MGWKYDELSSACKWKKFKYASVIMYLYYNLHNIMSKLLNMVSTWCAFHELVEVVETIGPGNRHVDVQVRRRARVQATGGHVLLNATLSHVVGRHLYT